jgi:hypothetical protein
MKHTSPIHKALQMSRTKEFEKKVNREERQMVRERAARVKKGGFKSESDYFKHANPFKNYD